MQRLGRVRVPAIMLSEGSQSLVNDVFRRGDLFRNLHRIHRRVVAWGPGSQPIALPHSASIVSEEELTRRLLPVPEQEITRTSPVQWTVFASRPLPHSAVERTFGSRIAAARPVGLRTNVDAASCWIESLESGWLFLVPDGETSAWLLAVGGRPESLLGQSSLIVKQIETLGAGASTFPAHPRIADPLCGPGWLACGTAALAFDPLCGDGTGHAIREAILAAAVIQAAARGLNADELLAHYRARLLGGFRRHLELCLQFYEAGRSGSWWDAEIDLLRKGIAWCEATMATFSGFRYQLRGFELQPVNVEAHMVRS